MADVALGAVQLVVGLIRDEARLLGEVSEDARFIVDEMEIMSSHLRCLVEAGVGAGDHRARTWTKQVMEFALDSKECVDEYLRSSAAGTHGTGLLGRFRLAAMVMVDRHRVATRIQKLKVRAREIAERLQRYAVTVPPRDPGVPDAPADNMLAFGQNGPQDPFRRIILTGPKMLMEGTEELIRCLKEPGSEEQQWPRVIAIVDGAFGGALAEQVYSHSSDEKLFQLKASITIRRRPPDHNEVLLDMLCNLLDIELSGIDKDASDVLNKLPSSLKGKKLLLVIFGSDYPETFHHIIMALDKFKCSAGSAIVFSTSFREVAEQCSPTKCFSLADFHLKKADFLTHRVNNIYHQQSIIEDILAICNPDVNCVSMFLCALFSNPNRSHRTESDLTTLKSLLESPPDQDQSTESKKQDIMIAFCYERLPRDYKICLWYSTFCTPRSHQVRKASLLRRWIVEGLITPVDQSSALEEAKHCFDALITQNLLSPRELGGRGKIKTCAVHPSVIRKISEEIPTLEDLVLTNQLPLDSDILFSVRNGFQLHQSNSMMALQNESMMNSMMERQKKIMMEFLKSLRTSSSSQLLRVLDLEGYKELKDHHLYNICKIRRLKYLNLRNTDVAKLPTEIKKLEILETLDIRQTRVQALNVVLPKLKHLLAGCVDCPSEEATAKYKGSFSTMCMPRHVARMQDLEILSHVKVSDSAKELINIGKKLKKLRKLGVVLSSKKAKLEDLFLQIDKYNIDLRSLSVRMEQPDNWNAVDSTSMTLSGLLESLNICGIRGGLPHQIKELHQLAKITLRDTLLKEDALCILGVLRGLRCLRLCYHSFAEGALTFENGQFIYLMELVLDDDILTRITFAPQTAPKLSKMVCSSTRMKFISGVQNLPKLRSLQLNRRTYGPVGLEKLQGDIDAQGDDINSKLNLSKDGQGSEQPGTAR